MGSQIAIVQSAEDEQELVSFLQEKHRFLALPRVLPRADLDPVEFGASDADKQLFFLETDAQLMREHVRPIEGGSGGYQVDRNSVRGLFIEWNRTTWEREGEAQAGRFYFDRPVSSTESSRTMDRAFRAIQTWTKKHSPMRSDERHPMYVSRHLASMVREGRARIVYPNGSDVKLVENAG